MLDRRLGILLRLMLCPLAACAAGCTAVGYIAGAGLGDEGDRGWGHAIVLTDASKVAHGTPVQVVLADSGYVRGLHLGVVASDPSGASPGRSALRLGVGNRILLDRAFSSGEVVSNLTREHVPDTLVFLLENVRELRLPGSSRSAAMTGAAVGFVLDTAVVIGLLVSGALLVWWLSR